VGRSLTDVGSSYRMGLTQRFFFVEVEI
jgi:hypothetical protein